MRERTETGAEPAQAPLSGIRVADFTRVLAGPYATMTLADFGADVIKIEPPGGDDTRHWTPPADASGMATYFAGVNRGKRSVVLDLNNAADLDEARRLASSADVVVENFRPGVMTRFGLDYHAVAALNPGVVYCSITGFGDGAGAALPGYDLLVQAVGGLMSITGEADGPGIKAGVALVDVLCGQNAVSGILLALRERERSGRGQRVQVNLLHSLLSALTNQASSTLATGVAPRRMGNAHPSIAPYALFRAADRDLVIAVGNDRQFAALAGVLGAPSLLDDPRFATNGDRVAQCADLTGELEAALGTRDAADWVERMNAAGVPAGLVNDVSEALALADRLGLNAVADLGGTRSVASPIGLDASPATCRTAPPALNADAGADWMPRPSDAASGGAHR